MDLVGGKFISNKAQESVSIANFFSSPPTSSVPNGEFHSGPNKELRSGTSEMLRSGAIAKFFRGPSSNISNKPDSD